jgi:cytochrome P450
VKIPAGSGILVALTAANNDSRHWDDPFRFDIRRRPERNMSFGAGPHTCIGMGLARGQIRYALRRVLETLPNLRPDLEHWAGTELKGWGFRGPTQLPALWDAS